MILRAHELHTYYGLVHMLQGVSLEVGEGEVLAILGRNGAGKTTVIKSITGLVPPRRGNVFYKGEDIIALPPHAIARRGIAYVPASRGIFSALTAMENLTIAHRKGARWDPESVFEMFPKLAELRGRRGRFLSGGEQQMLAIGRALVTDPSLILLDEPSQGLAPLVVEAVMDMLRRLKGEGMSMILVEQNVELALDLADRACILEQGAKVFEGPAAALKADDAVTTRYLGVGV